MEQPRKCLAVVRVRGISDIFGRISETMSLLHLGRNCHATLIDNRPSYQGMLQKAQNYLTWGEVSKETLIRLLRRRGEIIGGGVLTEQYLKEVGYSSFEKLADALLASRLKMKELKGVRPIFRLPPPSRGYKGTLKRSFSEGGNTGYRGEKINELINRMV